MKKNTIKIFFIINLFISIFAVINVNSQEDMKNVDDSAFNNKMRHDALFNHDKHNEKAKIEECSICHHVYEDGKLVEGESSEDKECSECHGKPDRKTKMDLIRTFHIQCKGCHEEKKKGPMMCTECHKK